MRLFHGAVSDLSRGRWTAGPFIGPFPEERDVALLWPALKRHFAALGVPYPIDRSERGQQSHLLGKQPSSPAIVGLPVALDGSAQGTFGSSRFSVVHSVLKHASSNPLSQTGSP